MYQDPPDPGNDSGESATREGGEPAGAGDGTGFEAELNRLESAGAMVLVVSDASRSVTRTMCSQVLGGSFDASRRRVLGLIGNEVGTVDERLPDGARKDPAHLQVVEFTLSTRSAAASSGTFQRGHDDATTGERNTAWGRPEDEGRTEVTDDSLAAFGAALAKSVGRIEDYAGTFEPQELRVGVDSLDSMIDIYGIEETQRFVHILRGLVKNLDGLGHVHLPAAPDDPDVSMIAPLCDVVVEVREVGDVAEYRLRLTDGPSSEWLPVPGEP